jgi:hypothetical protein
MPYSNHKTKLRKPGRIPEHTNLKEKLNDIEDLPRFD